MAKHPTGYSGTPLARKLGLKDGLRILVLNAPTPYRDFFDEWPEVLFIDERGTGRADFIHLFAKRFEELETGLKQLVPRLDPFGQLWISWPKKTSVLSSEIGKFDVMKAGQAVGLVDVKVAAIDADWSGHKFVVPVSQRPGKRGK